MRAPDADATAPSAPHARETVRTALAQQVDLRQPAFRGFAITRFHVATRFPHGAHHFVERHDVVAVGEQRISRAVDGAYRCDGVAFDTRNLHVSANRVAGESEVVF